MVDSRRNQFELVSANSAIIIGLFLLSIIFKQTKNLNCLKRANKLFSKLPYQIVMCTKTNCALCLSGLSAALPGSPLGYLRLKCCFERWRSGAPSSAAGPRCTRASTSPSPRSFPSGLIRSQSSLSRSPAQAATFARSQAEPY